MTETFYDLLGVSPDASTGEIEDAYREAVKETHPDVSDDVDAGRRTKRLNKARDVLTDDKERARYDRLGHEAYTGGRTSKRTDGGTTSANGGSGGNFTPGGFGQWTPDGSATTDEESAGRASSRRSGRSSDGNRSNGSEDVGRDDRTGPASGTGSSPTGDERSASERAASAGFGSGRAKRRTDRNRRERRSRNHGTAADAASGTRSTAPGAAPDAASAGSSPSARRQAAAGTTDGPNPDDSWNAWESTRAWAVRQGASNGAGLGPSRLFLTDQSMVLLASAFFLYPFFVFSALFPPFPLTARLAVAVCTLLMLAFLLSIPEAAVVIFGLWSVLVPLLLFAVPAASVFSLIGVVALVSTWLPFGLSVLTLSTVRP